jgi:hypothetical protein
MDVQLTDEQEMLFDIATQLGGKLSSLRDDADETGWSQIRSAGVDALRHRSDGQPAATGVEVGLIAEAFGSSLTTQPFLGATLGAEMLGLAGLEDGPGENSVAVPVLAPSLDTFGGESGGIAWDAFGATHLVVARPLDNGKAEVSLHALDDGQTPVSSADMSRTLLRVDSLGRGEVVGQIDPADQARWTALALASISCELVGVMDATLKLALEHAGNRAQFDQLISSFQAIQHICADQHVSLTAARSCAHFAAWAVDELPPDEALLAARVAKVYCGQAAREGTEASIQVHGGMGMTWECDAHRFLRRALLDRQTLGGEDLHLSRIADTRMGPAPR